jgi:hypothetical protein
MSDIEMVDGAVLYIPEICPAKQHLLMPHDIIDNSHDVDCASRISKYLR